MMKSTGPMSISLPLPQTKLTDAEIGGLLTAVVIDPAYSHALEEHPIDAPVVRECFNQKGAYMQFQIEPKHRYLRVCLIDEVVGIIGFQIVDIVDKVAKERTAYIKEEIHSIKQLLEYIRRLGYPRFTGGL